MVDLSCHRVYGQCFCRRSKSSQVVESDNGIVSNSSSSRQREVAFITTFDDENAWEKVGEVRAAETTPVASETESFEKRTSEPAGFMETRHLKEKMSRKKEMRCNRRRNYNIFPHSFSCARRGQGRCKFSLPVRTLDAVDKVSRTTAQPVS